jgi:hypothetical protein
MNALGIPVDGKYACLCCGYLVHDEPSAYDICPICFWEDCPLQASNPDDASGPNHTPLREAQRNFREFGSCERETLQHCRKPESGDKRHPQWVRLPDVAPTCLRIVERDGVFDDYTGPDPDGKYR